MLIMASPLSAQKKIERRMPLGMEGAFRIMNMVGSVVIHGWNKDTVLVRGTLAPGDQFYADAQCDEVERSQLPSQRAGPRLGEQRSQILPHEERHRILRFGCAIVYKSRA